ncbi:hypothetical protein FD19_GL001626 [Lacticaseibacillus thailandensis DSM 22698 = JCM 13996]|uniref:Uncharacterized protein n=1 Tax=Lacticaseibacillus thailandensis DSM 22698 = JCM 13996 TaxID=1423810 RepID=A0A0R2CGI0_9LACO|nr:hypothetical protein FD19_GL001626 [Lacticaseibacillus thailandensis DSM 22698 = JCM 13996]
MWAGSYPLNDERFGPIFSSGLHVGTRQNILPAGVFFMLKINFVAPKLLLNTTNAALLLR